ncbi:hypothetical protein NA57DRAFT_17560, partial [Rhizodiscina lignyota]
LFFLVSLLSHHVLSALPNYTGQYSVGTIDVEVPVSDPRNVTDTTLKATGQAAFQLQTVLFSLYYPIPSNQNSSKAPHFWLPRPISLVADGIAKTTGGGVDPAFILGALTTLAGNLTIPAKVDVSLLGGSAQFPILMFSPGDGSLGTWYSNWAGEMASRGSVVAALQHRDGSSPATQVMIKGHPTQNVTALTVDDISPSMNNTQFKLRQLQMRQAELEAAIIVVQNINNGSGAAVTAANSRGEGQGLYLWKNRLDMQHMIVSGHSFGSNLALQSLKGAPSTAIPANASINFDPGKDSGPLNTDVSVPTVIMDSEEWSSIPTEFYGQQHFDVVKDITLGSLKQNNESWFMTLLGTSHVSITDAPLITTSLLSFFTNFTSKIPISPSAALANYVSVSNDFVGAVVNGSRMGELARSASYPEFKIIPNGTILTSPWEIHVAP